MILVDTSVWVDYLRTGDPLLSRYLNQCRVLIHPFVLGELACGNLQNRQSILQLLQDLPATPIASNEEVLFFTEKNQLMGCGIGYIDTHLLAAVSLANTVSLWTLDKSLGKLAAKLNLAHDNIVVLDKPT